MTPSRSLDSRTSTGGWGAPLGAGDANVKTLQVTGRGVPETASSVVVNLTATDVSADSFLQVWPTGQPRPNSSNVNVEAGQTTANLATLELGVGGQLSFYNAVGQVNVVADVVGYFDPTGGDVYHPLSGPTRVLDDRVDVGAAGPWGPGESRSVSLADVPGVPSSAAGVVLNATVTDPSTSSFITLYPNGAVPNASNLNFTPGQTVANLAMPQLSGSGSLSIYNQLGTVDVIGDLVGYFAPS